MAGIHFDEAILPSEKVIQFFANHPDQRTAHNVTHLSMQIHDQNSYFTHALDFSVDGVDFGPLDWMNNGTNKQRKYRDFVRSRQLYRNLSLKLLY